MKFDLTKKMTIGAKRTLLLLRDTLRSLLCEKSFESIQVTEICERSMIPKSTFYNYFDDKYDLLHYFFQSYELEICTPSGGTKKASGSSDVLNKLLDSLEKNWSYLEKILHFNSPTGYFYQEYHQFFIDSIYRYMIQNTEKELKKELPFELIAKMNAYAVLTVLEWVYVKGHPLSREEMITYIQKLRFHL